MCKIENDDILGSYGKSHDIYVYREAVGGGSACGRDRKRRVVHKETKCACLKWGWCVRRVCENHITREIDICRRRFVCMGMIHSI